MKLEKGAPEGHEFYGNHHIERAAAHTHNYHHYSGTVSNSRGTK